MPMPLLAGQSHLTMHECAATSSVPNLLNALSQSKREDAVICQLHDALLQSATPPNGHIWSKQPFQ